MGYSVGSLINLGGALRSAGIAGKRVIDLGSQDVTIFDEKDLENARDFVSKFGGAPGFSDPSLNGAFPVVISARDIWSAAGFDYACCDVDRRPGTVYVDFNTLAFDRSLYGEFDLVLNAGTTEHLPNPLAAFFLMHYLCRKGGLLYNEVPFSGWFNHGLSNLTPKFWHTLRWMNSYDVVSASVRKIEVSQADEGNFGGAHLNFIQNLRNFESQSASLQFIFRKAEDRGFVPPYDAVVPTNDGGKAIAELVYASLVPFVRCGSLRREEAVASVNAFLLLQCHAYRMPEGPWRRMTAWADDEARPLLRRIPFLQRLVRFVRNR